MEKRYKSFAYDRHTLSNQSDGCAINGCQHPVSEPYKDLGITIRGNIVVLSFCAKHGSSEAQDERLHRMGL